MREVNVTYCDQCGKEITPPYSTLRKDGKEFDVCDDNWDEKGETCKDKFIRDLFKSNTFTTKI